MTKQLLDLTGKTALITGASGGIGAGIATTFALAGAKLVLHYHHNDDKINELVENLCADGTHCEAVRANLAKPAECAKLIQHGSLDILINNAALQPVVAINELTSEQIDAILQVNLRAPMLLTQAFAKQAAEGGAIVNIASIEGIVPAHNHSHYATSKAGLLQFTKASALELGQQNIRVNAICPGLIERPEIAKDWPAGVASWQEHAPLTRLGTPADVAQAALFFASPAATWITGAVLPVDGGMLAQPSW